LIERGIKWMEVLSYASCREVSPPLEKAEWLFLRES
jgi:hypothetical protein